MTFCRHLLELQLTEFRWKHTLVNSKKHLKNIEITLFYIFQGSSLPMQYLHLQNDAVQFSSDPEKLWKLDFESSKNLGANLPELTKQFMIIILYVFSDNKCNDHYRHNIIQFYWYRNVLITYTGWFSQHARPNFSLKWIYSNFDFRIFKYT